MRDYRPSPSALISICGSLMRRRRRTKGGTGISWKSLLLGASERASHCPLSRVVTSEEGRDGRGGRERHSTNDVIMEKIEPEAPSSPPLFGFASHPHRRSFRGAPQGAAVHRGGRGRCSHGNTALDGIGTGEFLYIHPVGQVLALLCPSSSSSIPPTFLPLQLITSRGTGRKEELMMRPPSARRRVREGQKEKEGVRG